MSGGKSPCVIFDDADLENAVSAAVNSIQSNSGQACMASSRVYVQDTIADKFINLYKEKMEKSASMGDLMDPTTNHGPQADEIQYKTVLKYIELGKQSGKMILGEQKANGGFFINP